MVKSFKGIAVLAVGLCAGIEAFAVPITVNFGNGFGVDAGWPVGTSAASSSTTGVVTTLYPITLAGGAITVTSSTGVLACAQGVTAGTCGFSAPTISTAYGLGVSNGRVDVGEFITFTVNPGFTAILTNFTLTGFGSAALTEQYTLSVNGGAAPAQNAPGVNIAIDSYSPGVAFSTLDFGAGAGNYSMRNITFDITAVPEPVTVGLVGAGLVALGIYRRRKRN